MILKNLTKNFTTIPNELIIDTSISEKAFRLYCYLASKPKTWKVNNKDIQNNLKISDKTLAKIFKELINSGWIAREKITPQKAKELNVKPGTYLYYLYSSKSEETSKKEISSKKEKVSNSKSEETSKKEKSSEHSNTDINISNTKFSNTDNINTHTPENFYQLYQEAISKADIQSLLNSIKADETFLLNLLQYRKQIESPVRTIRGIIGLLKKFQDVIVVTPYTAKEAFEVMMENEWKSPEALVKQYKRKKRTKSNNKSLDLSRFGIEDIVETKIIGGTNE